MTAPTTQRECTWPNCLTKDQQWRLADEIRYEELHDEPYPDADLTDWRQAHSCVDSGSTEADPFAPEPPR